MGGPPEAEFLHTQDLATGAHVGGQSSDLSSSCGNSYRHRSSRRVDGGVTECSVL